MEFNFFICKMRDWMGNVLKTIPTLTFHGYDSLIKASQLLISMKKRIHLLVIYSSLLILALSSRLWPSSLWDTLSWFPFVKYQPLKSMLSIKARFSILKPVCPQSLFEFSPLPTINTRFHSVLQFPRFISSIMSSILSYDYVLYHTYGLFHYICTWPMWLYMVIFLCVRHVHLDWWCW